MSSDVVELEDREWQTWKASLAYFVAGRPCSGVDEVGGDRFDVWKLHVPFRLLFAGHYRAHGSHRVIGALDVTICAGVVQAGRHLVDTEMCGNNAGNL